MTSQRADFRQYYDLIHMRYLLLNGFKALLWSLIVLSSLSAQSNVWDLIEARELPFTAEKRIVPDKAQLLEANIVALKAVLASAPNEMTVSPANSTVEISLPNPDGEMETFKIVAYDMMEPALQERWDYIQTYRGVSTKNNLTTIRLDWTARGFHAMVLEAGNYWFVDPYYWDHDTHYQS